METTAANKVEITRPEFNVISSMIEEGSSVLDLGCGDGELLALLKKNNKTIKEQGIEIDEKAIYRCVARGLSVFHGDIDSGLSEYDDKTFDYVILNQSFQQVRKPEVVLEEALRVGKKVIAGFPNFAHYSARFQLAFRGKAPVTRSLPYQWFDTPNLHFLSIADFYEFCRERKIKIERSYCLGRTNRVVIFPDLFALTGIFLISKAQG